MKCLIADDDAVSRIVLSTLLRAHDHHVVVTENGRQAWDSLASEHFSPHGRGVPLRAAAKHRPPIDQQLGGRLGRAIISLTHLASPGSLRAWTT